MAKLTMIRGQNGQEVGGFIDDFFRKENKTKQKG